MVSSDSGGLLLWEVEVRTGIARQFRSCFTDYRNPDRIEHRRDELVGQLVCRTDKGPDRKFRVSQH
jgi:hypothetical protein